MKTIPLFVGIFLLLAMLSPLAVANKTVFNASEVNDFFSDRTMTVRNETPDKKTGETAEFKAFFSKLGGVRAIGTDGTAESYNWQVTKDGSFCVQNSKRFRDGLCGFVVKENDTYRLYTNKRGNQKAKSVNGRAVFDNRWKHSLTFSDIKQGEQL